MDLNLKTINERSDLSGKRVLVRVDFNVPVENNEITDDFRIRRTLPTIEFLKKEKAKIILISHMSGNEINSLKPVAEYLPGRLDVTFLEDYFTLESEKVLSDMKLGDVILFENLRANAGEKENDELFAKSLASMADIYVNEAFAVSHREHASIVGVPKLLPSYAGMLFADEVKNLSVALNPPHPFLFILGGAKFETKIPLARKFVSIADDVVLAGALSNEVFQERGLEIGKSLVSEKHFDIGGSTDKVLLPVDLKAVRGKKLEIITPSQIEKEDRIVDIGPKTVDLVRGLAKEAKCILWNGPVGEYKEGYKETSLEIARAISESGAMTITGGGDTLSAISEIKVEEKFTFVSTAGGAMLDFLADGTLPGIEALIGPLKAGGRS